MFPAWQRSTSVGSVVTPSAYPDVGTACTCNVMRMPGSQGTRLPCRADPSPFVLSALRGRVRTRDPRKPPPTLHPQLVELLLPYNEGAKQNEPCRAVLTTDTVLR